MAEDHILLEGMTFFGRHGTLPAERELGQRFVVDIEMRVDLRPAGLSDDLGQTVDYGAVHDLVKKIAEGEPLNLIEAVAERVATAILQDHPRVETIRVRVAKPDVRLEDTILGGSAVEILRHQKPETFRPPSARS